MAQFSFDIISRVDFQEVDNAVNQAVKELRTRFDFRGSKSSIEFLKDDNRIRIVGDDDLKLRNLQDILKTRIAARKIPIKALQFGTPEQAFEGTLRQDVDLVNGIPQDKAKELVKIIKESRLKVQVSIQGDEIRVTSKNKDDLQSVIQLLNSNPLDIPIQFTNYR
ncbi:MAG: YajQ family cyclic di-GMP-binding protein [Candidatus Omnitrophota bacterium]|nr:YajQ family cyclic di-GMP-binding protein [Candidatus Omnitrophota bacterium]